MPSNCITNPQWGFLKEQKMDLTQYKQMPDLPNADIMFTSELEDMAGSQLADYMSDEEYRIELELIEREQREEEYQRELREFKLSRRIW